MIYIDENDQLRYTDDYNEVLLAQVTQELKLFKNENPIDIEAGIDYFGVFRQEAFLRIELDNLLYKYRDLFDTIEVGDIVQEDEICRASIYFKYKDGLSDTITLDMTP